MAKPGSETVDSTMKEEVRIRSGIKADPDTMELDDEWFAKARPVSETHPQIVERYLRRRGKQWAPAKEHVSMRPDADYGEMKMTIYEAARQVMLEAGKPLSTREIYDFIINMRLYEFKARDPISVLRSTIRSRTENINNPSSNPVRYFRLVEGGKFMPLNLPVRIETTVRNKSQIMKIPRGSISEVDLDALRKQASAYNCQVKNELLESIKSLDWDEFERFSARLLPVYGFEDVKTTSSNKDKGIDGYGKLKVGLAHMNVAFQCKRWARNSVGRIEVDQFRGAIQGEYEQGVFFTTSTFTSSALEVSIKKGAVPVILIDGMGIVDLMVNKKFGVQKDELHIYSNALDLVFEDDIEDNE